MTVERHFHDLLTKAIQARVPSGLRVLDVGCGEGRLLEALQPSHGVGVDLSPAAVAAARKRCGDGPLRFFEGDAAAPALLGRIGGPFDAILMVNVITRLADVPAAFESLHAVCHARTRLLVYSHSRVWQPLLRLAELLQLRPPPGPESWLPSEEVRSMLQLADYEIVRRDAQVLCPLWIPLLSGLFNRYVGRLP